MKIKRMTAAAAALTLAASMMQAQTAFAATHGDYTDVGLNSGTERSSGFVSVNVPITIDGKELRLVAAGLTEGNKEAFIKAIEDNYSLDSTTPIYIHDDAFVDAEKFDSSYPHYDSGLCWASSCSDILWLTGWAQNYSDPLTGKPFTSEDDIFELYSKSFVDKGAETNNGLEWFFDNLFFQSGAGNHTFPLNQNNTALGVEKDFVASKVCNVYDVTEDPSALSHLLDLDMQSENACGFGLSVGGHEADRIGMSEHALTAEGIIYDPEEQDPASRYKAIIIIDSDNDSDGEFEIDPDEAPDREKIMGCKTARPNSYTVYDLNSKTLADGHDVWEIVNYTADANNPFIIYDIIGFPLYDPELIAQYTETEGTRKQHENVDLIIDYIFTTDQSEPLMIPFKEYVEDDAVRYIQQDAPINLNVFVGNKAVAPLDENYADGNTITFDWTVTNKADGAVVYSGSEKQAGEIYNNSESSFLLHLNQNADGTLDKWVPGSYTVTVKINADRAITESYYLNNDEASFDFMVLGNAIEPDSPADSDTDPQPEEEAEDTPEEKPAKSTATTTSNPKTAATAAGALALAALGVTAVALAKKRNK